MKGLWKKHAYWRLITMANLLKHGHKISDVCKGELWMAHDAKSGKVRPFLVLSEVSRMRCVNFLDYDMARCLKCLT